MIFKNKKTDKVKKAKKAKIVKPAKQPKGIFKSLSKFGKLFTKLGIYFKGAWIELKQVRWPDRKATWSLTGAVLIFTGFFIALIVLLDAGFDALFNLIIK